MPPSANITSQPARELIRAAVLGSAYFLAAAVAARYTRFEGGVAMIWIANAILFADLRYRPERSWISRCMACGAGGGIATAFFGLGPAAALPLGVINIAEAVGGALLMRRFRPVPGHFSSFMEIGTFVLVVGVCLPAATAFPAAFIAHMVANVPYWSNWTGWFAGHALGVLTIVPFLNLALNGDIAGWARRARRSEWFEAGCLLFAVVVVSVGVFIQERLPLLFLPLAPMMLSVFRLGRLGAAASLLLLTLVGTVLTLAGEGPITLIRGGAGLKVQFFQFYLVTAMLMTLPAAAELKRRRQLYSRLQQSSALYKVIADRTGDIILALQLDGTIDYASPSFKTIGGYNPEEWQGRRARDIIFAEDQEAVAAKHVEVLSNPDRTFMVEFRAARASGELGWFESHGRAIVDQEGRVTGSVNIIREMSDRKARELDLARSAATDPLTGLANRRSLQRTYEQSMLPALDRGKPLCVALFDLDHFKSVNDAFGHDAGDAVIRSFAETLRSAVRGSDVVARFGGEEFAALLLGADIEQAHRICDRVRSEFGMKPFSFEHDQRVRVTVSVGLASINKGTALEDAFKAADMALYRAKNEGRDRLAIAA